MDCNCHDFEDKFIDTDHVMELIRKATENKQALSLTRFSHAELTYLNWQNHEKLVRKMEKYRDYNGVDEPIEKITGLLVESMKNTTITGFIPKGFAQYTTAPRDQSNGWYWYNLTKECLHRENFMPNTICSVWSTQEMIYKESFWELLKNRTIVIVGRRAKEAVPYFENKGVDVTKATNLEGINQVDRVKSYLTRKNWDIAIISAGIPATILTPQLASETGRVVIDFGHALDRIIDGDEFNFDHLVKGWWGQKRAQWRNRFSRRRK